MKSRWSHFVLTLTLLLTSVTYRAQAQPEYQLSPSSGPNRPFLDTATCPLVPGSVTRRVSGIPTNPLAAYAANGQQFTGSDLRLANGRFTAVLDVSNASGQILRLIISSLDPTLLLAYLNAVRMDFVALLTNPAAISVCKPTYSEQQPDPNTTQATIDVEFVLNPSSGIQANQFYMVYYFVDPPLSQNQTHSYRSPRGASNGATSQVAASSGRVRLTMWDDGGSYLNAEEHGPSDPVPPALVATNRATFSALVRGMTGRNTYSLRGSFGTVPCQNCGVVDAPRIAPLNNGTGLSNGSRMNNGEFQVEGYCPNGQAEQDGTNWFCKNGSQRTRLQKRDFDQICRRTYGSHPEAFALQDGMGQVASFRWRCYGRA